jgi:hypothetical protein
LFGYIIGPRKGRFVTLTSGLQWESLEAHLGVRTVELLGNLGATMTYSGARGEISTVSR